MVICDPYDCSRLANNVIGIFHRYVTLVITRIHVTNASGAMCNAMMKSEVMIRLISEIRSHRVPAHRREHARAE